MENTKAILIVLAAVLLSVFLRLDVFTMPIQGKDSWRQSKTGWNIRYFVREDANIFNPRQPYLNNKENIVRYEFPIMQWSIAMVQKVTGEHILVARSIVFLISLFTLLAVFKIALLFTESKLLAGIAVWIFTFLPTFFYNATSIMPDILALCFGMYYVLFFFRHLKSGKRSDLLYAALFISLAGLAKLPFILLGTLSVVYTTLTLINKQLTKWGALGTYVAVMALALVPVLAWYAMVIPTWEENNIQAGFTKDFVGWPVLMKYFKTQMLINFPVEILNIPALLLLFAGIFSLTKTKKLFFTAAAYFFIPLLVLYIYFLYVLNVIGEAHDYYLMPFYPIFLLAILAGLKLFYSANMFGKAILGLLLIAMPIICWQRTKSDWDIKYSYFNQDFWLCSDELKKVGTPDDLAIFVNDQSLAIFPYIVDKSGYVFWNDHLPVDWIKDMYTRWNARYLYSDSRVIESQEGFMDCIEETVLECGTIKVFRLKTVEQ